MCAGCRSYQSKDFDANPFGTTKDGSMGHGGITITESRRFTGDGAVTQKFEGESPSGKNDAKLAENTGRGD